MLLPVPGTTTGGLIWVVTPVPELEPVVVAVGGGFGTEDDAMAVESSNKGPRQARI